MKLFQFSVRLLKTEPNAHPYLGEVICTQDLYELEIQKDEEMEKGSKKGKTVALVAEKNEEHGTTLQNLNTKDTPSMKACKGRTEMES